MAHHPLVTVMILCFVGAARGDPPPGVKIIRIVLRPAISPSPALRYPLLPELRDQKPGNAVPFYRKANQNQKAAIAALDDKQWYERIDRWRELPLDKLPCAQVHAFFRPFEASLREVEDGARHEYADWELTDKLRKMGIGTLLPDIQEARQFASLLSLRVRLAMAEGRHNDAVRDLQTLFALARHVAHAPTLINALVGIAISNVAAAAVDDLIQQPGMPNLYWSLTDLPQPFIDLRMPLQGERVGSYGTFPGLPMSPNADIRPLTPEQVQGYVKLLSGLRRNDGPIPDSAYTIMIALDLQRKHEKAKQALVDAGWSRSVLEKMPHIEVGVLHGFLDYERQMDDAIKWSSLPYWQAAPALMELEKRRSKSNLLPGPEEPAYPIADFLAASNGRILFARTRIERKIAALRCLEAIRLYAANHDGKLPVSLTDIKVVPIPVDPYTGEPFVYMVTGEKATLSSAAIASPVPGRKPNPQDALYYEIVLKR